MADMLSTPVLDRLTTPEAIKELTPDELEALAEELRATIIDRVSQTGGHLASNLGVVELTIALLTSLDLPRDKVIWDVGHQSYSYKILTGRRAELPKLRKLDGLSGFPKRSESVYDSFDTGHSSTSISAALGLSRALRAQGRDEHVVAVIGDGALTGGMAYEALNNITAEDKVLIILNDNQMSIDRNVGGMSRRLEQLRVSSGYLLFKRRTRRWLERIPLLGKRLASLLNHSKNLLRRLLARQLHTPFDTFDVKYYGPIDGHDVKLVQDYIDAAKALDSSVVIHVCTQKGKGYKQAEEAPENYHGVSPFVIERGVPEKQAVDRRRAFPENLPGAGSFTQAFTASLLDLAERDERIVAISAAMESGTGLTPFRERYPGRFYDTGIAEQHAVTLGAGMAVGGLKPVVALYSSFVQRALDQVIHDVALQNLPLVLCLDRSGVVGEDGETHQGIYALSFLQAVPNLEILCPRDYTELYLMLRHALHKDAGPTVIRYARGASEMPLEALDEAAFTAAVEASDRAVLGQFEPQLLRRGREVALVTWGNQCGRVLQAVERVRQHLPQYQPTVIDLRTLNPFPEEALIELLSEGYDSVLCIEEIASGAGIGDRLGRLLQEQGWATDYRTLDLGAEPVLQGKAQEVLERHGLAGQALADTLRQSYRQRQTVSYRDKKEIS